MGEKEKPNHNYWDQNYDHNRAMVVTDENDESVVMTKEDKLYLYGKSKGASLSIKSNFLKIFQLELQYCIIIFNCQFNLNWVFCCPIHITKSGC